MCSWIDLNDTKSPDVRELARTLCENRVARGRKAPVGDSARSGLRTWISRAISSEWLQVAALSAVMVAGGAILGAVAILALMGRVR